MEYAPDFNEFIKTGGNLYIASSELGLLHHKFCIIDGEIVITGSYNWTYYAETRNMENILITDDSRTVSLFKQEYNRLIEKLQSAQTTPIYSWDSIEEIDNMDFTDINYEVEHISHIINKPIRKVTGTKTQAFVTELKNTPKAVYNIGILAKNENNEEFLEIFIPKDKTLPYESNIHQLYFNIKEHKLLVNHNIYSASGSLDAAVLLKEVVFNEVTSGIFNESVLLNYKMSLDINGDIKMEVSCRETGKRKTITLLNQKFVKYE